MHFLLCCKILLCEILLSLIRAQPMDSRVVGTAAWRWAGRGVRGRLGRVAPLTGTVAGAKIGETERRLKACWRDCCLLRQNTLRPSHRLLTEEIARLGTLGALGVQS